MHIRLVKQFTRLPVLRSPAYLINFIFVLIKKWKSVTNGKAGHIKPVKICF
jgi:hypothetical protein